MRTLSATLLAAQKISAKTPYLKVEISQKVGAVTRLDWHRLYTGSEPDYYHAVTVPGDGSLIRARIAIIDTTRKLYRQRVTSPGEGADFTLWTYIADTSPASTALASHGTNVIHFWAAPDQKTIKYQESSDYGATWGTIQTLLTATNAVYHLAAAMKPDGDVCLFYFEWDTIKAIKREAGVWGSPQAWTNTLDIVSGIATTYHSDWNLVITGRDTADKRGLWSCVYGDGGSVASGSWSPLREIMLAESDANTDYKAPSLARTESPEATYRLFFLEVYAATQEYKRPYFCHSLLNQEFIDTDWREPVPFNLSCEYGLAICVASASAFLTAPYGVWHASLSPSPLDVTPDILELKQTISPQGGKLIMELRNDHGQYANFDKLGHEILLSPGYRTTAGEESSSGPSFWVEGWEYISQAARSSMIIYATDTWGLLQNWTARRQIKWQKDSKSVKQILTTIFALIGIPVATFSTSALITTLKPAFTIHPGQSAARAVKALLDMVPDVLLFREATAYVKYPQTSDATDYIYGTDHPILSGRYKEAAWEVNRVQVYGRNLMVERFNWSQLDDLYDRLHQVYDLNITTTSQAEQRADALLREAEIEASDGEVVVPMNCGQELWDVIEINDPRLSFQIQPRRCRALEVSFSTSKPEYQLKIHLGAL